MSIEKEVLVKCVPNCTKLLKYGFVKGNDMYKFSKKFMDNTFSADIKNPPVPQAKSPILSPNCGFKVCAIKSVKGLGV